jgi:hypothetical protein
MTGILRAPGNTGLQRSVCSTILCAFPSQVLPSAKVEIRIIEIVLKKARQVRRSVFEFGYFQSGCGLKVPSNSQELYNLLRLRSEGLVDL